MNKVSATSGGQKLLSVIQRSLGQTYKILDKSAPVANVVREVKSVDQLAQAANRAGIAETLLVDTSGLSITERAKRREQLASARRQHNIEKITELAINYCTDKTTSKELDIDWFNSFIAMAEDISAPKMQLMWAKILAKEISAPATFSMKSLETLKQMTMHDADDFLAACALLSRSKQEPGGKIIYGYHKKPSVFSFLTLSKPIQLPLANFGLNYTTILNLMNVGILYNSELESTPIKSGQSQFYNNNGKSIGFKAKSNGLILNYYKLTTIGHELSLLVGHHPNDQYLADLKQMLSSDFVLLE